MNGILLATCALGRQGGVFGVVKCNAKTSLWLAALATVLVVSSGCNWRGTFTEEQTEESEERQLPFERSSDTAGISPTAYFRPTQIPSGTLLVIHLKDSLSSASALAGDSFTGSLVQPILVRGETLAPIGSMVTGKVLAAGPAQADEPGYLRLALQKISIGKASLDLRTSSLFAKAGFSEVDVPAVAATHAVQPVKAAGTLVGASLSSGETVRTEHVGANVKLSPQQRLTFRLTESLSLVPAS